MTEAVNDNVTPDPEQEKIEVPAIELRARELGWRPKEDFGGDEDNFVDAKEFVQRQPLFEKIEHQSRELKNVKKTLDALKGHYTKVQEVEYHRALATLQASKAEAISEADGQRTVQIENQIRKAEREFQQIQQDAKDPVENNPSEFVSWKAQNAWYEKDESMRIFADAVGSKLSREGMTPPEVLVAVSKKVKAEFPHKFVNPNKANAPDVGVSTGGRSVSTEKYELTELERSVMNTLVRSGTMTKEQYIADLKKLRKN